MAERFLLLLLLLRFPAVSLGFTILGEIFANVTVEVVTFRLREWCMLGVFLVPAFTRLDNERWDLLRWQSSHPKEFLGNGIRTHVNSKGKKFPSTGKKNLLRGGSNPGHCIKQDSEPSTLPTSYSGPLFLIQKSR